MAEEGEAFAEGYLYGWSGGTRGGWGGGKQAIDACYNGGSDFRLKHFLNDAEVRYFFGGDLSHGGIGHRVELLFRPKSANAPSNKRSGA